MVPLSEIIIEKIKGEGLISFRDFMEMALYYPETGYYTAKNEIGINGDFYTSSNVTSVFGAMIAKQIEEMWYNLRDDTFTIVEYGAGTGLLCRDILDYLKQNQEVYSRLRYCIIEKSVAMRRKEKDRLCEKVSWHNSIEELGKVTGCILSNELIDNFPVHQVVMAADLMEVFVDYDGGFIEVLRPAPAELKEYLEELTVQLPDGFRTEINLEATEWMNKIAGSLEKGYVITIDYGHDSYELYHPCRKNGTLLCYHKHKINDCPYMNIGEQDITSHVNFSALCHWGLKNDLECCGITDQRRFLLSLGFNDYLQKKLSEDTGDVIALAKNAAFINSTLLFNMGTKFKVLIQNKSVPKKELMGLSLANV